MITNMANLVLVDKQATPVNHNFIPAPIPGMPCRWQDRGAQGVAIGFATCTFSIKEPTGGNGVYREKLNFSFPKVDLTIPAKPVLMGTSRVNVEFVFIDILSDQERKDIVQQVYTSLAQGSATALGDNITTQALAY